MKDLILASGSPRRKELMETLEFPFRVVVSDVEEVVKENLSPAAIVKDLAYQKAKAVFKNNPDSIVIGSDTVVVCDGKILGKPANKQQAKEMMMMIKGKSHKVITGLAILHNREQYLASDTSKVFFEDIDERDIEAYIETNEPYDKAGGYAIQGWAGKYISKIEGNYYTIVGLPINKVYNYLKKWM